MRKKILGFVFAAALLVAMAVPLVGVGTALAQGKPVSVPVDGAPPCAEEITQTLPAGAAASGKAPAAQAGDPGHLDDVCT